MIAHTSRVREWQLKTIKATLEKRNTFILQLTGSGKSLYFQFPALVTEMLTVVIVYFRDFPHPSGRGYPAECLQRGGRSTSM